MTKTTKWHVRQAKTMIRLGGCWDHPQHPPSLIIVFAVRTKKAWVLSYPLNAQQRLRQTGRIPRLIWVFAGRTKKVREKSRECTNHKPQPFPDTKRKRKQTKPKQRKSNKHTESTKIRSLFPKRGNRNTERTEKTQEQNNTRQDLKQIAS